MLIDSYKIRQFFLPVLRIHLRFLSSQLEADCESATREQSCNALKKEKTVLYRDEVVTTNHRTGSRPTTNRNVSATTVLTFLRSCVNVHLTTYSCQYDFPCATVFFFKLNKVIYFLILPLRAHCSNLFVSFCVNKWTVHTSWDVWSVATDS